MSYNNPAFPTQNTVYSNVNNGYEREDLEYIRNQSNVINSYNQPYIGHIPNYIYPTPNDNLIQQTRWNVDAQTTQYNPNQLSNTRNNSGNFSGTSSDIDAADVFTGPNKNYNPYIDYISKQGLLNDNYKSRIQTKYINIDSKARRIEPLIRKDEEISLTSNALFFSSTTLSSVTSTATINLLNINIPNHNYSEGDRITINNVETSSASIKALYNYVNNDNITKIGYSVIFEKNRRSLVIRTNFAQSLYYQSGYFLEDSIESNKVFESFDPNFIVGDGISYDDLKNYDTSDMYVTLSGFEGTSIGNIPTNFLNSTHQVHLVNPDTTGDIYINVPDTGTGIVKEISGFYIELPTEFKPTSPDINDPPLDPSIYSDMVINIKFNYIGGIPINFINADIPITNQNINGFHLITNTTRDTISIKVNKPTYYINPTPPENPEIGEVPVTFGSDSIFISKVSEISGGYPEQNDYVIEFPQSINNVFMVKLVGTAFPNTSRTFKKQKNNKIYWQNLDDGEIVYSAEVAEGNYDPFTLKDELEKIMYDVVREGIPETPENNFDDRGNDPTLDPDLIETTSSGAPILLPDGTPKIIAPSNKGGYTNRVLFVVSIDPKTNITSFTSFKEAKLRRPIIKIRDANNNPPPTQENVNDPYEPPYTLKICHPAHGLEIDDEVLFSGFITSSGIPDTVLNTTHRIVNITSDDTYEIKIDNFNLSFNRFADQGGYAAKVYVKNRFRLLFDKEDTMGAQLGFRNPGNEIAVTKYGTKITNQDAYQNETPIFEPPTGLNYVSDGSGKLIVLRNNSLQFSGEDYILMIIREFGGSINISDQKHITKYFAKIHLSGLPGKILFDTFISVPITFYDVFNLKSLSVSFIGSDGLPYDFNGVDHSFKLEITSLDLQPQETGINSTNNFI